MNEVSAREAEVLAALADHRSNQQIARALHISVRTVESHVSSLLRKYGVADRRELADLVRSPGAAAAGSDGVGSAGGVGSVAGSGGGAVRGLPVGRGAFVGRATDAAAVREALGQARLVTLVGPGGMGKTRLAAVVAGDVGVGGVFVDLVPVREGQVARAVASALEVAKRPPQTLEDVMVEQLQYERLLLVLDNCEQVIDEVAVLVERLLRGCPDLAILATSRERLAVPGERTVLLPPLDAAGQLFVDRARAADPEFSA
ncbi:MAG: ATPase, partial [Kribbellaceae bacterium]|nr:ATPase [Kribbellaceae bacterium]